MNEDIKISSTKEKGSLSFLKLRRKTRRNKSLPKCNALCQCQPKQQNYKP